jgi:hypothetical protein
MNSCAPLPHAVQRAALGAARVIRAVTPPVGSRLVRQMEPSPETWKHGSRGPRRSGARVCPKLAAPGNVTVRAFFTQLLFDSRSHNQFYGRAD